MITSSISHQQARNIVWMSVLTVLGFKAIQYYLLSPYGSWKEDAGIVLWAMLGVLFLFSTLRKDPFWVLMGISAVLLGLAVEVFVKKEYQVQNLVEHSLQYGTACLLAIMIRFGMTHRNSLVMMRWLIVGTFVGHGVYAMGFQIEHTNFMPMTSSVLHTDVQGSKHFLLVAGILDMIVAVSLLTDRFWKVMIWYAIFWGSLTASVRLYYFGYLGMEGGTWLKGMTEMGFRLCHGLIPLAYWMVSKKQIADLPKMTLRDT